ncbi:TspO/MBR family protein [Gemmatimonas phototrophica]|uniref:Tryptophan-rich sensory protein n=1 Tax=Gemmatimonas phototrophica TaxID=1379270 RepID=A0A143BJH9_9BACT|nr:TspO/MBR family protein [Gemmatimonas phototrophica]AMW05178.1 tryptophan-rich sensory protein [Gemmatimonas phototrophica]
MASHTLVRPRVGWLALAVCLLVTTVAAFSAAFASRTSAEFYALLDKPAWAPPAWLFGPVWSVLYLLMAVAAWRVWRANGLRAARAPLGWYVVQLALNALWTWLFFVWRDGPWATVEVLVLWAAIAVTAVLFRRRDTIAAGLLLPYLVWVSFASALTISVWQRNPALL